MRKITKIRLNIICLIFAILALTQVCSSQALIKNNPFQKVKKAQNRLLVDSSQLMFQIQYPVLESVPPLSTGMPYDVLIGYIYLDSLMRFTNQSQTDTLISSWNTMNDTLSNAIKYLYILEDYNPIIFRQYWDEIRKHTPFLGSKFRLITQKDDTTQRNDTISFQDRAGIYHNDMYHLALRLKEKFANVIPNMQERAALFSLSEAEYILKVHILAPPISMHNKYDPPSVNSFRYQVAAEVLDTIKGKVFKALEFNPSLKINNLKTDNNSKLTTEHGNPIIQFQYTTESYWILNGMETGINYLYPDSAFYMNGGFQMFQDQECIVFLSHYNFLGDPIYDYYELGVEPRASACALPIINGQVRDINHIWSQQLYMPYNAWKNKINFFINKILTGIY